jgi:hypothetical protein
MSTVSIRYIVHDVDATIDFYTIYLQFALQMHPNDLFAMLGHGDLRLVLVKPTGPQGPAGGGAAMPDGRRTLPADPSRGQDDPADGVTTGGAAWNRPGRRRSRQATRTVISTGPAETIPALASRSDPPVRRNWQSEPASQPAQSHTERISRWLPNADGYALRTVAVTVTICRIYT